ncbi:hypothetical protein IWX49DRAFT_281882 [Phyllosticta citricarpa]|uniref:Uncharacterized protein n=1 Tax=Phyllosticta citricarpa TaxID=55181 RepID=A0ABR1MLY0_9PEZI
MWFQCWAPWAPLLFWPCAKISIATPDLHDRANAHWERSLHVSSPPPRPALRRPLSLCVASLLPPVLLPILPLPSCLVFRCLLVLSCLILSCLVPSRPDSCPSVSCLADPLHLRRKSPPDHRRSPSDLCASSKFLRPRRLNVASIEPAPARSVSVAQWWLCYTSSSPLPTITSLQRQENAPDASPEALRTVPILARLCLSRSDPTRRLPSVRVPFPTVCLVGHFPLSPPARFGAPPCFGGGFVQEA